MNKKNLSVVMAGAMLATSVAPVLADTTTVNGSNKGLIIKEFRELIESKTFANEADNRGYANKSVYYVKGAYSGETKVIKVGINDASSANKYSKINEMIRDLEIKLALDLKECATTNVTGFVNTTGKSGQDVLIGSNAYYKVYVNIDDVTSYTSGAKIKVVATQFDTVKTVEDAIKGAPNGMKFEAWDKGHREENGKFYAYEARGFEKSDFQTVYDHWNNNKTLYKAVLEMVYSGGDTLTVKVRNAQDETTYITKEFKVGDPIVEFTKAHSADHKELAPNYTDSNRQTWITEGFDHFAEVTGTTTASGLTNVTEDISESLVKSIEIDEVDNVYNVALSELYDGLFLTDKGQELLDTMKLYDSKISDGWTITNAGDVNDDYSQVFTVNDNGNGLYTIEIEFKRPVRGTTNNEIKNRVVITTNDKAKMDVFANGLKMYDTRNYGAGASRKFPVQVLEGSNRYETAVKVAKENADITTVAENGNIVLVNGRSLVDGLAAAPLAASVWNKDNNAGTGSDTDYVAPILLTEANGIPKATKDYMKELIGEQQIKNLDKITVYLVGGEAVISKAVENDLKEIGFRVVRAGGEDREETSLKVAELMHKDTQATTKDQAFLVGANGEADAMSIASVAAATKSPIIVESVHGIKEDTIEYLEGYKNDTNGLEGAEVTIIGGEKTVSKATENTLVAEGLDVERVYGANRKDTNAMIIDRYYGVGSDSVYAGHKFDNVVISKDGMNNPDELIDALTATSLAVRDKAPIVLATKSLSSSQTNALYKNASHTGVYVYQIGGNSAVRDVVKEIAVKIGLAVK